jgi:hypothetical protein
MAMRIRFQYPTGSQLGYSIERLGDGMLFDPSDGTFKAAPSAPIASLPEDAGIFLGRYKATLSPTPAAQFTDGDYTVTVHDKGASGAVVAELSVTMHGGDDATFFPASTGSGSGVDPWAVPLPGSYPAGSAGAIVGQNLDARVSTRSTFAGGVVAGVTAPVTVGANTDKAGYTLSPSGLDAIPVEGGVNARQALSPILAACAGVVAGAGTGVIVIKGGNAATTRITATTDNAGNRSSVTLTLPN